MQHPSNTWFSGPKAFLSLCTGLMMLALQGCSDKVQDIPLDDIQIDLKVMRMEQDMLHASEAYRAGTPVDSVASYLKYFAPHRPFIADWMFMGQDQIATDSVVTVVMHEFISDRHGRDLLDSVQSKLGDYDPVPPLIELFKRYHHHFPSKSLPIVVTYVDGYPPTAESGLDQVFISPRFLGIGMHYFLGPEFAYYPPDLPKYIRRRCNTLHLPSVVAHKIAEVTVPDPDLAANPVLIDFVISAGIKQYMIDQLLGPQVSDSLKLFYTTEQIEWADYYEGKAFKDMMPDFYEIEATKLRRYLEDSPFTSQLNRGSAPRLGQYLGYKIVQKFMKEHPEVTLEELVKRTDYQKIFQAAKYRPQAREEKEDKE